MKKLLGQNLPNRPGEAAEHQKTSIKRRQSEDRRKRARGGQQNQPRSWKEERVLGSKQEKMAHPQGKKNLHPEKGRTNLPLKKVWARWKEKVPGCTLVQQRKRADSRLKEGSGPRRPFS